jgi:hypothetical protein
VQQGELHVPAADRGRCAKGAASAVFAFGAAAFIAAAVVRAALLAAVVRLTADAAVLGQEHVQAGRSCRRQAGREGQEQREKAEREEAEAHVGERMLPRGRLVKRDADMLSRWQDPTKHPSC